ncbi:LuxR family transcriptional regulator, maltose regulon positive regulatory protein [Pseudomonas sp. IT-347P]
MLASAARVKLVCAPAGSGKSALLAECLSQAPASSTVLWLALDGRKSCVDDFRRCLALALQVQEAGEAELVAVLASLTAETWLFLDDYCRQPDPLLDGFLDRLLAIANPALTWWIGTRCRPKCNWPRLLLDDELYISEARTLAMTADEVTRLLRQLPAERVDSVVERLMHDTGGWCAGVRMALLQTCDWAKKNVPKPRFDTLHDYLDYELFSALPPELAEVWRVLAHMPRFNAEICEHLFGAGEGAQYLRTLQTLGCFIEPWHDSSGWWQVFPALARLIQSEQWPEGRTWHRLACQWFTVREDWTSAFEHALLAEEYEVASSLLQYLSIEHLFEDQMVVLLLRLHGRQDEALTLGSPHGVMLISAALSFAGRFEQATLCMEHLSRFFPQPSACQQRRLLAHWQAQQGWLLHLQGRGVPACEHFSQALAELDADAWPVALLCMSGQTQQALLLGELDQAHAINRNALRLARARNSLLFEGLLELDHAQLLEQRGATERAEVLLADVHELLRQRVHRPVPLLGRIAIRRGRLAMSMGNDVVAAGLFQRGLDDCLRSHDKRVLFGYLGLAQLAAGRGDYAQAFLRLREVERVMQQRQIPDTVYLGVLLQVRSEFWLQRGRAELAREALSRLLKHYEAPDGLQAPPATLELIPRIEYLLIVAQIHMGQAQRPMEYLQRLIDHAHARRMHRLEAELLLASAEAALLLNHPCAARQLSSRGRQLATSCHLTGWIRQFEKRCPALVSDRGSATNDKHDQEHFLSVRETQVLALIASGYSNQQIAEKLFISLHTVKTHVRRIHVKLGVERRTHAVARARMLGLCV